MAAMIRRYHWVSCYKPALAEIRLCVEKFGEPRGKKTALVRALKTEVERQSHVSSIRWSRRAFFESCSLNYFTGQYDPVARKTSKFATNVKSKRWLMVTASEFGPIFFKSRHDPIIPFESWEFSPSSIYCPGKLNGYHMFTTYPEYVITTQGTRSFQHNVGFLVVKAGDTVKCFRIPGSGSESLCEAIDSLKTASVRKAEEAGHRVSIDWDRGAFLVRTQRSKKVIPFKKHSRERKKKAEATNES